MNVWHITDDVGYGGHLLYRLVNNAKDLPEPSLSDIKMPNLLDNVPDLFFLRKY